MKVILYAPSNINSVFVDNVNDSSLLYLNQIIAPFIVTRIKSYIKNNIDVDVVMINKNLKFKEIQISKKLRFFIFKDYYEFKNFFTLRSHFYDFFFIHFLNFKLILILFLNLNLKKIIYVHGIEFQKTSEYIFELPVNFFYLIKNFFFKFFQKYLIILLLLINYNKIKFVFVSRWMKKSACKFIPKILISKCKSAIISNPVDKIFFIKNKRLLKSKRKILIIKNFNYKKYAGDLILDFLVKLSYEKNFSIFEFTIVGHGKFLNNKKYDRLKELNNITFVSNIISSGEIKKLFARHNFFLSLTRMDAQSVIISEALTSGINVISSNICAIPEFIQNKKNGILINNNYPEFKKVFQDILQNKIKSKIISLNSIKDSRKFHPEYIYEKEINFIKMVN
jgi:glycosyltransferase involved in cell wall biosynthesis